MSRHFHANTSQGEETFERLMHASAAGGGTARACDDPSHEIEVRACPVCDGPVTFVAQGQDTGLYSCAQGCTKRLQRIY